MEYLGKHEWLVKSQEELKELLLDANRTMIKDVGGMKKWDELAEEVQQEHVTAMLKELVLSLGKEAFDALVDEEKRELNLFIWEGSKCCQSWEY